MSGTDEPAQKPDDSMIETEHKRGGTMIFVFGIVAVALVIAGLLAADALNSSDDDNLVPTETTQPSATTSVPPASTPQPSSPQTSGPPPSTGPGASTPPVLSVPADPLEAAVWPLPDSDTRFTDPVEAARSFAVDFVGFTDPVVGEFMVDDSRSGEVNVRRTDDGPVTVVFLRQLTDDEFWWVLGSVSADIVVEEPDVQETIASPLTMTGQSRAFEGTVNVALRADGSSEPLFESFVTGGSGPDFGPFEGTFEFDAPDGGGGALVSVIYSAEDGTVTQAAVTRVFFDAG